MANHNSKLYRFYKIINKKYIRILYLLFLKFKKNHKGIADFLYYIEFNDLIDWENPKDLNQWINWLQFNTDTSEWSRLTDKYLVRDYVKEKGFEKNLVSLLAIWDHPSKIKLSSLPNQFVIKMNNGSGDIIIVEDKSKINESELKKYYNSLFNHNFSKTSGEKHYEKIKPLIIVEELLDVQNQQFTSSSLIDYKIWCFNGNPECVRVYYNRTKDKVNLATYDLQWQRHLAYDNYTDKFIQSDKVIPKPENLNEMINMAKILSKGFPQVRVDLYSIGNKIYFGELTFTASTGKMKSFSKEYLQLLGDKISNIGINDR